MCIFIRVSLDIELREIGGMYIQIYKIYLQIYIYVIYMYVHTYTCVYTYVYTSTSIHTADANILTHRRCSR